jgi:hypothetical protein
VFTPLGVIYSLREKEEFFLLCYYHCFIPTG